LGRSELYLMTFVLTFAPGSIVARFP
jgi:hypothetical protein